MLYLFTQKLKTIEAKYDKMIENLDPLKKIHNCLSKIAFL
jgi:hypothetical protein